MRSRAARLLGQWLPVVVSSLVVLALVGPAVPTGTATARAEVPAPSVNLQVMLAIDVSGSMRPALGAAKDAATRFIGAMPSEVPIGLVTFGDVVTVAAQPTTDRALLALIIGGVALEDDTALYDGVIAAAQQFDPAVPDRVIVLLSDGKDEGSSASLEFAVAALAGVRVEAISLTTERTDLASLSALGAVTSADDLDGVAAAFSRVAGLLAATVEPVAPATTDVPPTSAAAVTTIEPAPVAPATSSVPASATATVGSASIAGSEPAGSSAGTLWFGGVGVFLGLFLLVWLTFPRQRVSKSRLGIDDSRSVSEFSRRTAAAVEAALERRGSRTEFATTLAVAKIAMQPGEFVGFVGAVALVLSLVGLLAGGVIGGILMAAAVCVGARLYVGHKTSKRRAEFSDQLPDVLQLVTTALRSGFGLAQALDVVAQEAEEPARSEFAQVLVEGRLGRDFPGAMRALAERMQSEDLEWIVAAIEINRDIGGNLSEVLSAVGNTIRERQRVARQVATYTAEGRLSARIMTVLPVGMALWQWRANPDSFERLFSGGGLVALIVAGVLLVLGFLWIRSIVNSISA